MCWKLALRRKKTMIICFIFVLVYHPFVINVFPLDTSGTLEQNFKNGLTMLFSGPPGGLEAVRCHNCTAPDYNIRLTAQCTSVFLLVLVTSRPADRERRDVIRSTWARQNSSLQQVRTMFILGRHRMVENSVDEENTKENTLHGDIVQFDFLDTYENLTIKTLSALKWVKSNCPNVQYILKTDDDTFNNIPATVKLLQSANFAHTISGHCFTIKVDRQETARYYVPVSMYPYTYLPIYCGGPAYIIPRHLLERLLETSKDVKLFPSEDVYVTGLVRHLAGIAYRQMPGCALYFNDFAEMSTRQRQHVTSLHNVHKFADMRTLWKYYSTQN